MDLSAPSYCKDHNQHLGNFCPQCCKFLCGQCECPHYPDVNLIPYWYINKYLKSVNIEQSIPTEEQIKEAKAGYLAAYYTYVQTLRSAFADVDNSLTNQQKVNAQYSNQLQALAAAKKSYALALARYKAGAKDYRDVANAALTVDTATLNVTLAKMQQMDAIVGVYQSVAAGYV